MTYEQAKFILRHGSAEGKHKYFEAINVIENEITRQQAEIERQREYLNVSLIRSEARKEFAERVKRETTERYEDIAYKDLFFGVIDNILKEMEREP